MIGNVRNGIVKTMTELNPSFNPFISYLIRHFPKTSPTPPLSHNQIIPTNDFQNSHGSDQMNINYITNTSNNNSNNNNNNTSNNNHNNNSTNTTTTNNNSISNNTITNNHTNSNNIQQSTHA